MRRKRLVDKLRLSPADRSLERNKQVRRAEISVVFRNFVFQDQMVSKSIPGQVTKQAVILMPILSIMGKDDIRVKGLESFEAGLDALRLGGKVTSSKLLHHQPGPADIFEKLFRTRTRLLPSLSLRAENDPENVQSWMSLCQG